MPTLRLLPRPSLPCNYFPGGDLTVSVVWGDRLPGQRLM